MTLELNAKLAESFFLFRRKVAFDGTQIELMAHLMKVSVREQSINRLIQSGDSIGNASAPTLERLLDRNQLIRDSKSRNRTAFVNLKNDLPAFGIKHDVGEVGRYGIPTLSRSALQGVAFAPHFNEAATPYCQTLWAMFGLLPQRSFTLQSIGVRRQRFRLKVLENTL